MATEFLKKNGRYNEIEKNDVNLVKEKNVNITVENITKKEQTKNEKLAELSKLVKDESKEHLVKLLEKDTDLVFAILEPLAPHHTDETLNRAIAQLQYLLDRDD
jgi:hypothetical protein